MKASITAGAGPYSFGQAVPTFDLVAAWSPSGKDFDSYWARADVVQNGEIVYSQYQSLSTDTQQQGWKLGPTPLWSGGAGSGTLSLQGMSRGVLRTIAEDTFVVGA